MFCRLVDLQRGPTPGRPLELPTSRQPVPQERGLKGQQFCLVWLDICRRGKHSKRRRPQSRSQTAAHYPSSCPRVPERAASFCNQRGRARGLSKSFSPLYLADIIQPSEQRVVMLTDGFGPRMVANMEIALEEACKFLPVGNDGHEARRYLASKILECATSG